MVRLSPTHRHRSDDNTVASLVNIKTYAQLSKKVNTLHYKLEGPIFPQTQRGPMESINELKPFGKSVRMVSFHLKTYTHFSEFQNHGVTKYHNENLKHMHRGFKMSNYLFCTFH